MSVWYRAVWSSHRLFGPVHVSSEESWLKGCLCGRVLADACVSDMEVKKPTCERCVNAFDKLKGPK